MRSSVRKGTSAMLQVASSIIGLALLLPNATAFAEEERLSTIEVIEAVKGENKGRLIKAERKESEGYPNCHHVKLKMADGEFKLIRYKCPDS
ncbi:MAG TPA: hypothetical protein ENK78_03910 [Thiothrix sp.]|nr:hypothetical protein [Thiothrix sp.]